MAAKHETLRNRLKKLAVLAMHAYPARYCRSRALAAASPVAGLADLHRQNVEARLALLPFWLRWLVLAAWPPGTVLLALALTMANGASVAQRYRRGVFSQLASQLHLAFAEGVVPLFFYAWELHEPGNRRRAGEYLQRGLLKHGGLYNHLYIAWPERTRRAKLLNDKRSVDRFCRDHDLPAPRLFAFVDGGKFAWTDVNHDALPEANLFVKPWKSKGGRGAERWQWRDGRFHNRRGRALDLDGLTAHLANLSRRIPILVQECLSNHPDLDDLCAGALSTVRMYTFWNERGMVEHLPATFRTSQDPSDILDIAGKGALTARIDSATGILGPATDPGVLARTGWIDDHPFTGARIAGRRVPCWREAQDLVSRAHRALEDAFLVGWDIAITQHGPVIVEGNKSPDIEIEQRLNGPWGNQRFGELLLFHLRAETQGAAHNSANVLAQAG